MHRNEINYPNILIQCSLNQRIIIHMILNINLFYINYQQRRAICIRQYIPELPIKPMECIIENLIIHSVSVFSNYMKNYHIQNYNENCRIENCYIYQTKSGLLYWELISWWRHQMKTFSALLAICAGNSPIPGQFPAQRPVTRSFDVYFDLRPNKRLSKQS